VILIFVLLYLSTNPLFGYFCCMYRFFTVTFLVLLSAQFAKAQNNNDIWSLQRCVQYAVEHNISIQQDVLNKRLAHYTLLQSQLAQLPSLSSSGSYAKNFGRSIDPTTYSYVDAGFDNISISGNSNVLLFGWFQQRNTIAKNRFSLQASQADLDQLKDDVSLNVATGYLRTLLAQEQINASEKQVDLSKAQLAQTKSFANAGRLPELNVAQLESQLATDSSNLINAIATYNSAILDLKTLLNLDFSTPFSILAPDVQVSDQILVSNMQPEEIYQQAKIHFGSVKGAQMRLEAAKKGLNASKGALFPQLSLNAQLGTNWSSNYKSYNLGPYVRQSTGAYTLTNDTVYRYAPLNLPYTPTLGDQLSNNIREMVSATINVPLFNGWQSQYLVRQSKINLQTQELNVYQAELTLKQNVYKAHNDAVNSIQKYYASLRAEQAAQRALDFAQKRYDLGLTSTVDFLVTQNQHYSAAYNLLSSKYDLIFKLKVIDYYLGKELKL